MLNAHIFEFLRIAETALYVLTYEYPKVRSDTVGCPVTPSVCWHDALRDVLSQPRSYGYGHSNKAVRMALSDAVRTSAKRKRKAYSNPSPYP